MMGDEMCIKYVCVRRSCLGLLNPVEGISRIQSVVVMILKPGSNWVQSQEFSQLRLD